MLHAGFPRQRFMKQQRELWWAPLSSFPIPVTEILTPRGVSKGLGQLDCGTLGLLHTLPLPQFPPLYNAGANHVYLGLR